MNAISLAPLVNGLIVPILVPLLMALAGWALNKVAAYAHFQISQGQRDLVDTAIANGIAYAQTKLPATVGIDGMVGQVVAYVLPKIPGALKFLGVTPASLEQLIIARLPK